MSHQLAPLIRDALDTFPAGATSAHEQLSRVDFAARITFALSAPAALADPAFQIQLPPSPGIGPLAEALQRIVGRSTNRSCSSIAQIGLTLLSTQLPLSRPDLRTIDGLRNYLFHGGGPPSDAQRATSTLASAFRTAVDELLQVLSSALIDITPGSAGEPSRLSLRWETSTYDLSPLLAISPASSAAMVFSRLTSSFVVLNAATGEPRQQFLRADYEQMLRRLFRAKASDTLGSDFTQAAIEDFEGFREPGSSLSYLNDQEGVLVSWVHADGRTASPRQDRLRVGPDNAWQWQDGVVWKGYTALLRVLATWPMLTHRLSSILDERVRQAKSAENALLPLPNGVQPPFVAPTVRMRLSADKARLPLQDFALHLDSDVQANRGTTYLYFVHAEAGAGKTTALMYMAQVRAHELATRTAEEDVPQPLFLYVSARGNVLENLDQAINAAVAETRLLTSASVRALCRNGLIIPIIDGFDELVGSATYADALASLRPWLTGLGGRGVMLVSARSSYFVSLYEDSIRRETNRDISVRHHIVELDRWLPQQRDRYIKACGIPAHSLDALTEDERELLTLPFFSRACVVHLLSDKPLDGGGLLGVLIHNYVEREQRKLQSVSGESLIAASELQGMFAELAGYMMENSTREVALADLHLVAETSIGTGAGLAPELRNRLVALCGLDVQGEGDRRFRFSHEVFLDFFFGTYVGRELRVDRVRRLQHILKSSQLTASAARVALAVGTVSSDLLAALADGAADAAGSPLRSNLGLFWTATLAGKGVLDPKVTVKDAEFPSTIRLSQSGAAEAMLFEGCAFGAISLLGPPARQAIFRDCSFREIRMEGDGSRYAFADCSIDVVSTRRDYAETPDTVNDALRKSGATVQDWAEEQKAGGGSDLPKMARMFLGKMNSRVEMSIVVGTDGLPEEDPRLGWISRHSGFWLAFLRALEEHRLGYRVRINAGGPEKSRVRLDVRPAAILEPDDTMPNVREFWNALRRGQYD
jgi:hypothetical protein